MTLQGQKVGAYRLHEIIGTGGFATVYRGTHESLGIDRAVKVLEDRYNVDQRVRELFVREGRRAATLDTPYVVRVQDAGETDGHAWMAMDLMTGGTLADLLGGEGSRLAPDAVRHIGHDVALALAAAHAVGVLHRDVKPPNIFVMPDGGAKLGDFGVAGELAGATHASTIVGTFAYMAPETDDGQTTAKSDIYSLGAVLFEISTGTRPPGLARRAPTWPPGVDSTLRPLIHRMLDPEPDVRPSSAEVAAELAEEGDEEPAVLAMTSGRAGGVGGSSFGRWTGGVSLRVAAAVAVVAVALIAGAAMLFGGGSADDDDVAALTPPAIVGGSSVGATASPEPASAATPIATETATATPEATATATPAPTATATATPIIIATIVPAPTATPTVAPLPTVIVPPPVLIAPADEVRIASIVISGSSYAVAFVTGFDPQLPGQHVHFFYDTVPATEAGTPGGGPWLLYAGPSPFTGYSVASRPGGATQLCVLVANADHSVNQGTGNCVTLP